jgi:hypothetical protein
MLPFGKPVGDISEADLTALIVNGVREGKTMEYKSKLPKDDDKREYLADVSSFANTSGGVIVYGMEEVEGVAANLLGLAGIDIDKEILRLDSIIRTGVDPRIQGLVLMPVELANGNRSIVLYIPRSWSAPHMVIYQGSSRFFARHAAGKYQLDVQEIRQAFLLSEEVSKRIRDFRLDRISRVIARETPVPFSEGAALILHSIPASAFETASQVELPQSSTELYQLGTLKDTITDYRYNLDGLLNYYHRREDDYISYLQLFRNGIMEAVDVSYLRDRPDKIKRIPSQAVELAVMDCYSRMVKSQRKLGVSGPIYLFLTLTNIKDFTLSVSQSLLFYTSWGDKPSKVDRDILLFPEIQIVDDVNDWFGTLRPLFDMVWNAAGWPSCMDYDQEGKWNPRQ